MTRQKKAFELTMFAQFSTQYKNRSRYLQKHVYFFIHQSNQRTFRHLPSTHALPGAPNRKRPEQSFLSRPLSQKPEKN